MFDVLDNNIPVAERADCEHGTNGVTPMRPTTSNVLETPGVQITNLSCESVVTSALSVETPAQMRQGSELRASVPYTIERGISFEVAVAVRIIDVVVVVEMWSWSWWSECKDS